MKYGEKFVVDTD